MVAKRIARRARIGDGKGTPRAAELAEGLLRIGTEVLARETGMPTGQAERGMALVVDEVMAQFAKWHVYVPFGYERRNRLIWDAYHRPSPNAAACSLERINELAAEFRLTQRRIYTIVSEARLAGIRARLPAEHGTRVDVPADGRVSLATGDGSADPLECLHELIAVRAVERLTVDLRRGRELASDVVERLIDGHAGRSLQIPAHKPRCRPAESRPIDRRAEP